VFVCWCIVVFIQVKKCTIFFYSWSITFATLALGLLFVSSGRQVVERKLAERGEPVEDKHKSSTWKFGIFFYMMAIPFACTEVVIYAAFL